MELCRISNGRYTNLREYGPRHARIFDIITQAGMVQPKALQPDTYRSPNGASMRPNTPKQQDLMTKYNGHDVVVYTIPAGTTLPDTLILVHERADHFSLQAAKEMTLEELNNEITKFLEGAGRCYSKEQWQQNYPKPTISMAVMNAFNKRKQSGE